MSTALICPPKRTLDRYADTAQIGIACPPTKLSVPGQNIMLSIFPQLATKIHTRRKQQDAVRIEKTTVLVYWTSSLLLKDNVMATLKCTGGTSGVLTAASFNGKHTRNLSSSPFPFSELKNRKKSTCTLTSAITVSCGMYFVNACACSTALDRSPKPTWGRTGSWLSRLILATWDEDV
jgi:hypothetical protein